MLVVPCDCGAKLRVKDEVAGHRVKCPKCGAVIRAPKAAIPFTPPGNAAGAKRVVRESPIVSKRATEEVAPLDLLEQLSSGDVIEMAPMPVVNAAPAVQVGYAPDATRAAIRTGKAQGDTIRAAVRSFWADLGYAFIYPVASSGNMINLAIILLVAGLSLLCNQFACLGGIARLIIFGWTASIYMNVVSDTAAGSDDLPGPKMDEGWYGDIIHPAIMFFGTFAVAMLPAIAYFILLGMKIAPASPLMMLIWITMGIFLWPMLMLLFSLSSPQLMVRIDLIAVTIARTFVPYLVVWAALAATFIVRMVVGLGPLLARFGLNPKVDLSFGEAMVFLVIVEVAGTYFMLVSMRIIGLYYLHFKKRFAFELE